MTKKFTSRQVVSAIQSAGIVPLFTHEDADVARSVIDAAYAGGIRVFEFTNRKKNSFEIFSQLAAYVQKYPDFILGVGTVMDGVTTIRFIDAGAHFVVSPIIKKEMGVACKDRNISWIPGCATLTEIISARDHGAEIIKVFPGAVLGPVFVSSVLSVVPELQLLISGGVEPNEKSLSAWFGAGATCVGLGSQLFTREIIETKNWAKLQQQMADCLTILQKVRKQTGPQ